MTQTDLLVKENLAHDQRFAEEQLARAKKARSDYKAKLRSQCDHTLPDGTSAAQSPSGNGFNVWECSICEQFILLKIPVL